MILDCHPAGSPVRSHEIVNIMIYYMTCRFGFLILRGQY